MAASILQFGKNQVAYAGDGRRRNVFFKERGFEVIAENIFKEIRSLG